MDSRTKSLIIGALALLLIAAVSGLALYLGRVSKDSNEASVETGLSNLPVVTAPPSQLDTPGTTDNTADSGNGNRLFTGDGFSLELPTGWGILTCSNSDNFELDPTDSSDSKNISCDRAVKPVTILVGESLSCQGDSVTLGGHSVVKSKNTIDDYTNYRWCVNVGRKSLDISHRVSATGLQASSPTDYSTLVEQMITTIKTSAD